MSSYFLFYVMVIIASLTLVLAKSWQTALLLALIELVWVCLCAVWGVLFIECGDLFFLYWACVLLFFSAVELVISAVLLMSTSSLTKTSGYSKRA